MQVQVRETREYWLKLWYVMADGNAGEVERYQRMDIVQFWGMLSLYEKKIEQQIEAAKQAGTK